MENEKPNDLGKLLENTMAAGKINEESDSIIQLGELMGSTTDEQLQAAFSEMIQSPQEMWTALMALARNHEDFAMNLIDVLGEGRTEKDFDLEQSAEEDLEQYT